MFSPQEPLEKKNPFIRFIYREKSYVGRQQLLALIYYLLQNTLMSVIFLPRLIEEPRPFFVIAAVLQFFIVLFSFFGYVFGKFRLSMAIRLMIYVIQAVMASQVIYLSLFEEGLSVEVRTILLMAHVTLMVLNVALAIIALQRWDPLVLSGFSLAVCIYCGLIVRTPWFGLVFLVMITTFFLLGLLGSSLVWSTRRMARENRAMKEEEDALYSLFSLDREQVKAYVRLAERELPEDKVAALFEILGDQAQQSVFYNMEKYFHAKRFSEETIGKVFPELTPSEREVCRLVLQGRKLGDICRILQKNESNVTSTRSNIRKKLGLGAGDDLRTALLKVVEENPGVGVKFTSRPRIVEY